MVSPRRIGVPFCLPHKKEPKKVTAQGTGLSWLALRRRRGKIPHLRCAQTVPRFAPDASPSSRPNPLGGSWYLSRGILRNAKLPPWWSERAAKFFAYFLTPKSRAIPARRRPFFASF